LWGREVIIGLGREGKRRKDLMNKEKSVQRGGWTEKRKESFFLRAKRAECGLSTSPASRNGV